MAQELLVKTNYGLVQGRHRSGCEGVKYVSFQGIPYARPPVGELRFKVKHICTSIFNGIIFNIVLIWFSD